MTHSTTAEASVDDRIHALRALASVPPHPSHERLLVAILPRTPRNTRLARFERVRSAQDYYERHKAAALAVAGDFGATVEVW